MRDNTPIRHPLVKYRLASAAACVLLLGCRSGSSSASSDPEPTHTASAQRPSDDRPGPTERPRLVFPRDDIDTIRITGERGDIAMGKREGHWLLTSPPEANADTEAVERLLTNLEEVEFVERLHGEEQKEFAVHIAVSGSKSGRQVVSFRTRARPYQQVLRFDATGESWVVRGVAPWIAFASRDDFAVDNGGK